jgi:hypothetical protein
MTRLNFNINSYLGASKASPSPTADLLDLMLFFWGGSVSGDNLRNKFNTNIITVTNKDFTSRYIPPTSSATFAAPDIAAYKTADEDNFWYDVGGNVLEKTVADLYGATTERTIIKYSPTEPYNVYWICILKSGVVLTDAQKDEFSKQFTLWLYYFGELNDYGVYKDNGILP